MSRLFLYIAIFIGNDKTMVNESVVRRMVNEELSKSEVRSLINSRIEDYMDGRDFKKKVSSIAADVIDELLTNFWQRKGFWKSMLKR